MATADDIETSSEYKEKFHDAQDFLNVDPSFITTQIVTETGCKKISKESICFSGSDYEEQNISDSDCDEAFYDAQDFLNVDPSLETEEIVTETECKDATKDSKDLPKVDSVEYDEQNVIEAVCERMTSDVQVLSTVESGSEYVKYGEIGRMASSFQKMITKRVMPLGFSQECVKSKMKIKPNEDFYEQEIEHSKEVEDVVHIFATNIGLGSFYREQLQLSDVIKVVSKCKDVQLTQLGFYFLRNLIMLNFLSRDKMIQDFLHEISGASESDMKRENVDFLDDLLGNDDEDAKISPLDLIHCVFKCSSPLLKQVIASRLYMCQLAVPLIFPSSIGNDCKVSIWPLRSITVESKTNKSFTIDNAVTCPCHVVSFMRMGRPALSKSKLMNEIIYDRYHSFFFNKDCPLGTAQRQISEGTVETSWYLPSDTSSILTNITMFLNLRGDCLSFKSQMRLLLKISDTVVIILDVDCLTNDRTLNDIIDIQKSNLQILFAFDAKRHKQDFVKYHLGRFRDASCKSKFKTKIYVLSRGNVDKSTAVIKEEMRTQIKSQLRSKPIETLEKRVTQNNIKTDEDTPFFQRTRQYAEELINQKQDNNFIEKDKIVPLQGQLWHSWSKTLKEVNKSSQNLTLQEQGKKRKEMILYRKEQAMICTNLGKFMKTFLSTLKNPQIEASLFITWIKLFLNDRSRKSIPKLLMKYQSDWQNLIEIKDKEDVDENTKHSLQNAMNESEVNLVNASFGFEHLFREMGQIFEGLNNLERADLTDQRNNLAEIGADLVLMGHPFEIMDGDAGNVPILWVKAVLERLKDKIGDKRLLALSVLGIQSSGKSTLLNVMFGLQFAVSAGRCTRGVFMQMVPVEGNEFPFDFILVIDTEGLRTPELANEKHSHDNELATFVIGLGDITLINIQRENTAEIKNVLQIAVHAFLRLGLANQGINLKQKCIFVHQNVSALDANDKMMHGRKKFIETLDAMTKEAADQEGIKGIQSFNKVIEFDSEKSVWYFPDLWHGDPPMAPVNPGYSEKVSMVKSDILYRLTKGRDTYLTISHTISRIEDLWNGILKDDFVFSFRNSLEFKAYSIIEKKCQNLIWELEKFVFEFERSEAQSIFINCKTDDELNVAVHQINEKLITEVQQLVTNLLDHLNLFIENSSLQDVMIQWKQNKINRIKSKTEEVLANAREEINKSKEEVKINNLQSSQQRRHEIEITKSASELAVKMKGELPSNEEMEEKFDKWWTNCLNSLNIQDRDTKQNIRDQIKSQIWGKYPSLTKFLTDDWQLSTQFDFSKHLHLQGSFPSSFIKSNCIDIHSLFIGIIKRDSKKVCKAQALEITNMILRKIDIKLHLHQREDFKFNISYVNEILKIIDDSIYEHNTNKKQDFHFNLLSPYQSRLICHVACYSSIFYTNLQEAYNKKHSPKAKLEAFKSTVLDLFRNTVDSKTEDFIALGFFKEALVRETIVYVNQLLPIETVDMVWSKFSNGKYSLIKGMLTDESVLNDFSELIQYINDPSGFAETWIIKLINKMLFETGIEGKASSYVTLAEKRIKRIFASLTKGIPQVTDSADYGIKRWLDKFVGNIRESKELPLSIEVFVHVEKRNITHSKSFGQMVLDELDNIEKSVLDEFRSTTSKTVKWTVHPVSEIMKKLWGCTAKCMFCNEPCMNTDDKHTAIYPHKCLQHRPQAVSGWHKSDTEQLVVDFCNHEVQSDKKYRMSKGEEYRPYRDFKKEFPDWEIAPNSDESKYWMYILCQYKDDLMKKYSLKEPDIPAHWLDISKEEAINSL